MGKVESPVPATTNSPSALVVLEEENLFFEYLWCLIIMACKHSLEGWV